MQSVAAGSEDEKTAVPAPAADGRTDAFNEWFRKQAKSLRTTALPRCSG
jgi:hypothetical protein